MLPPRDGVRPVQAKLEGWAAQLEVPVHSVVVVGSRARGTHFRDSDIDVVVVSSEFAGMSRWDRFDTLLAPWLDTPALEPMGFAPAELSTDSLYLWDALSDGRVLRDDGTWEQARQRHRERIARGELTRTRGGWRERSLPAAES